MKPAPTLADMMIRAWSRPPYRQIDSNGWVPRNIALARKFVLDEQMSEYLADLGCSWLPGLNRKRKREMFDGYRTLSRLPHPITWVEYDRPAFANRLAIEWNINRQETRPWTHAGWLLLQHPKIETAFMALPAKSADGVSEISAYPLVWSVDGSLPPYRNPILLDLPQDDIDALTGVMTAIGKFHCPQLNIVVAPWVTGKHAQELIKRLEVTKTIMAYAGTLRFLWPFLTAINDTPTTTRRVAPVGGHMVGSSYKRFMDHTVISLDIPKRTTMRVLAKRVLLDTRRRAHMRRGHFRRHWAFPLNPRCQHELEVIPDTHMHECKLCRGRKMWITEHQAGDASLGWVDHDYAVHHKGKT